LKYWNTIFFILLSYIALAQQEYRFESFTTKDGLSHASINCLYKDSRGLLWIGTDFGLNMYDGNSFSSFYNIPGDTNSLPHNKILTICEDYQQRLWIGTQKGVSCFNLLTRQFINYSPFNKGPYHYDMEHCHTYITRDKSVWIGHNKGVIHLDPVAQQFRSYPLRLSPGNQYRNPYVSDFLEDANNDLWIATSLGVRFLKKGDSTLQTFQFPENHPSEIVLNACTRFAIDNTGTIYCGTWNGGVIYFDTITRQFKPLSTTDKLKNYVIYQLCFTNDRTWMTSPSGLIAMPPGDLKKQSLATREEYKSLPGNHPLPPPEVMFMLPDKNTIWLATNNGLYKITRNSDAIINYSFTTVNERNIISIQETTPGQLLILNELALITYDLDKKLPLKIADAPPYARQLIKTKNGYWLTQNPGLSLLDKNFRVKNIITHNDSLGNPESFGIIHEDKEGKIWLSRGKYGIRQYDPKTHKWQSFFTGKSTRIVDIKTDEFGNMWLAASLIRYTPSTNTFKNIPIRNPVFDSIEVNSITSVCPDGNGKVWISTYAGIYYYDYTNDSVINLPLPSGIAPRVDGLVVDKNHHLWMESLGKLVMYDLQRKTFKIFGEADGFNAPGMSSDFTVLQNGKIVIGYNGGFAVIDPEKIVTDSTILPPQFTAITIDNTPVSNASSIPVLHYNQSISFNFVSPLYTSTEKNQYAYQLYPLDKEWNFIHGNTSQRFANLPAGKYTFIVKAATASGIWNPSNSSFSFIIRPPYWKTWWFLSLLSVIITGSLFAFYRYRVRQLVKIERIRTRIATDLHDDIGATLSSISMYSDAVKQQVKEKLPHLEPVLDKMGENSRDMVNSMSDIVWAINPNNDDGYKLTERMESYARDLCSMKNVLLQFHAKENIHSMNLPLEYRKNIYLIFKESLNNALKYSSARHIHIDISKSNGKLMMTIADDGTGFDRQTVTSGNGLLNIVERAKEIKGISIIDSAIGKGTRISFSCPIP
jgi:ligand-binding sensor domain-containing protein/two-component sensor histidine kinase